jgi:replicative DNA helicase
VASHPESLLISAIVNSQDHIGHANAGITRDHFHVYATEWRWLERYMLRFQKTPSRQAFCLKFADFPFKRGIDDVSLYAEETRSAHSIFVLNDSLDRILDFVDGGDVDAAMKTMRAGLSQVEASLQNTSGEFSLLQDSDIVYADVKRRVEIAQTRGQSGVPTGFKTLDLVTGGAQEGDYGIVAARVGNGKTWTLTAMTLAAMAAGISTLFVTLEMTKLQMAHRFHNLLSSRYGRKVFSNTDLMAGRNFNLIEYKAFLEKLKSETGLGDVHIIDGSRGKISIPVLSAQIESVRPGIVLIDYLTLLDNRDKDWQAVAKLSNDIQALTKRYNVPIFAAAQVNRLGIGHEPPRVDQLGLSDAIGQDADLIISLAQQSTHVIKFRLAKFRNGVDQGIWFAEFNPALGVYGEVSGNKAKTLIEADLEED